jgi:DNA-binding response OmpR family regulator
VLRVLLIDDEPAIGRAVARALKGYDIAVEVHSDVDDFLKSARARTHRALLIDWNLRSCEGTELCATLRGEGDTRPIALVSGKLDVDHARDLARSAGADRYIEKATRASELARQIKNLARRRKRPPTVYKCVVGTIELRPGKIIVHDYTASPRPLEYQLLQYLLDHPGQVLSRERLAHGVWQKRIPTSTMVESAISRLRKLLGTAADLIETVPGGYRIRMK